MKKKLLLLTVLVMAFVCLLTISTSAATTVTDDDTDAMTLGNCVIANLDGVTIPSPTVGLQYSLDDETMTATITGKGSFGGGNLVFPSSVTYNGKTYTVKAVNNNTFRSMTYDLYVPDSITKLGGGSGNSAFGGSTIGKIYIGSGLTEIEQELFSGSKGFTAFVCKSKITKIGGNAFNQSSASGELTAFEFDLTSVVRFEYRAFAGATFISGQDIEFGDCVEFFGDEAFMSSKATGSVIIPEGCTLSYRCFNGTSFSQIAVRVAKGETKSIPKEFVSGASGSLTIAFNGPAIATGDHIFSGNTIRLYMPTNEDIEQLVASVVPYQGNERMENVTFYSCEDGSYYKATKAGVITNKGTTEKHCYSTNIYHFDANCSQFERDTYICYACDDEKIVNQGTEYGAHVLTSTEKLPTCTSKGYKEYTCSVCNLQYVADWQDATSHTVKNAEYIVNGSNITIKGTCIDCGGAETTNTISLVNKTYIEGYGLFDATLDLISVSADGVVTPNPSATFNKAIIYFPSYVQLGDEIVKVEKIQGFKAYSIQGIYIPDTVTDIANTGTNGCFGDVYDLKNVVIGKGVTEIKRETFCMGRTVSLDEFIVKGTITKLGLLCFSNFSASSNDIPYEFNTNLIYVGKQVNNGGNIIREAYISKGCDLSEKFAFNGARGITTVYIIGGDTPETALNLGQEFASNQVTKNWYIKGYVTVNGQAVLPDMKNIRIFMESKSAIEVFANAIKAQGYSGRINEATFMDCGSDTAWFVSSSADIVVHPSLTYYHNGINIVTDATCTTLKTIVEKCYVCDEVISTTTEGEMSHTFDGGVITTMPNCKDLGAIVYTCINCGETEEYSIFRDYETHEYQAMLLYPNGFAQAGIENTFCKICFDKMYEDKALDVIITVEGYSVKNNRTGISCGFGVNLTALAYYEQKTGITVEIGVIISNAQDAEKNGLVNEAYKLLSTNRGIQVEILGRNYSFIKVNVNGFNTDALKALGLIMTSYIVADLNGDGEMEISYIQHTMDDKDNKPVTVDGISFNTVSIDRASPLVAPDALLPTGNSENE